MLPTQPFDAFDGMSTDPILVSMGGVEGREKISQFDRKGVGKEVRKGGGLK